MIADQFPWGIAANVCAADSALRGGAKVYLTWRTGGCGLERVGVWGMSRGGRRIEKIVTTRRLTRFRAAWLPPAVTKTCALMVAYDSKAAAQSQAQRYNEFVDRQREVQP